MRAELTKLPDGIHAFTDYIDGLGEEPEPIRFQVKITIAGEEATVDWTGTSPQVRAAINAPAARVSPSETAWIHKAPGFAAER